MTSGFFVTAFSRPGLIYGTGAIEVAPESPDMEGHSRVNPGRLCKPVLSQTIIGLHENGRHSHSLRKLSYACEILNSVILVYAGNAIPSN